MKKRSGCGYIFKEDEDRLTRVTESMLQPSEQAKESDKEKEERAMLGHTPLPRHTE